MLTESKYTYLPAGKLHARLQSHLLLQQTVAVQQSQHLAEQNKALIAALQKRQEALERQLGILQESKQTASTRWGLTWGLGG